MFDARILNYRINGNSFPASCFGGLPPWRTGVGHISIAPSSKDTGHAATLYCKSKQVLFGNKSTK